MRTFALCLTLCLTAACSPGKQCEPDASASGNLCLPDAGALADAPLDFVVEESCGSPCDEFAPACQVTRDGGALFVALVGTRCTSPEVACPAICSLRRFRCALGPLPAGSYTVHSAGEQARTLLVTDGGVTRCGE